jgi:hypothetical protein
MCHVDISHKRSYINDTSVSHITPHHSSIKPKHLLIILSLHLMQFLNAIYNFVNLKHFITMLSINLRKKEHLCYFHPRFIADVVKPCCLVGKKTDPQRLEEHSKHCDSTGAEILCLFHNSKANYSVLISLSLVPGLAR